MFELSFQINREQRILYLARLVVCVKRLKLRCLSKDQMSSSNSSTLPFALPTTVGMVESLFLACRRDRRL